MKLRAINENTSDQRKQILQRLQNLSKQVEKLAVEELHGVLADPVGMVRHTMMGMKADFFLLEDETWWHQMFEYWDHLDTKILTGIYETIFDEVVGEMKQAADAGIILENIQGGSGFLKVLATIAALFFMFAFGPALSGLSKDMRKMKGRGDRENTPNIRYPDQSDLPPTPADLARSAQDTFKLVKLNPYIAYKFIELCVQKTKELELDNFDDPMGPGDLGSEKPIQDVEPPETETFNSGEEVEHPENDL